MFRRHLLTTTLAVAGTWITSLIRQVVIYKSLPVPSIGEYVFIATLIVFLQPLISGNVKLFLISRCTEFPKLQALGLLKTILLFEIVMGVVGFLLFYAIFNTFTDFHKLFLIVKDPILLYLCFPIVTITSLFSHIHRYLCSKLYISTANIAELSSSLLYVVLLSYFFLEKTMSVRIILLCWISSAILPFIGLMILLCKDLRSSEPVNPRYITKALRYSLPSLSSEYRGNVVGYFDRLAVGHYMTAYSLGLYGFIYNLINMAQVVARNTLDSIFSSYFLFTIKNRHVSLATKILDTYLRWSSMAAFMALIFFLFYGEKFILVVSNSNMLSSYPYFFFLWPLFCINMLIQIKSIYLHYIEEDRSRLVWVNIIIIPVTIIVYTLSIKYFGLIGASVAATSIALLTYFIMALYTRELRISPLLLKLKWSAAGTFIVALLLNKIISLWINSAKGNILSVTLGSITTVFTTFILANVVGLVSWRDKSIIESEFKAIS